MEQVRRQSGCLHSGSKIFSDSFAHHPSRHYYHWEVFDLHQTPSSHSIRTALLSEHSIEENQILQSAVAGGTGQRTWLRRENSTSRNLSIRHVRDPLRKSSALLRNLTYFLDDSILRVRGRLKHSNLSFDRKHPVILPQRHFLTELVIQNSH